MIRTTKRSEDERRRAVIPLPATIAAPSQTGKILLSSPTRGISARRTTIAARKIIEVSTSSASKYKLASLVPSRGSRDSKFHSRWTCFRFMNVTPPRVTHERYSVASCFLFYRHVLIYSFLRTCALHGTLRGPLKRKKTETCDKLLRKTRDVHGTVTAFCLLYQIYHSTSRLFHLFII